MILSIPLLAAGRSSGVGPLWAFAETVLVLGGVLIGAHLLVPRLLDVVSRTRQRDLFILTVFLVCLGTAWLVSRAGVSLALGAFLAGLVVAGSEYRHQALSDVLPLREALASVFFVSIGMLLDLGGALSHIGPILALLAALLIGKFLLVFLTAALLRLPLRVCVLTGTALAQVGEFSFVLYKSAGGHRSSRGVDGRNILVAIILSMLLTPFVLALGPTWRVAPEELGWLASMTQVRLAGRRR
jgi:CPA2 family monovalent cation:H+ antiporter-2